MATQNDRDSSSGDGERVEVLLPNHLPHGFDYLVPAGMALCPGDYVAVPWGKKHLPGIVWNRGGAQIAAHKLRAVTAHLAEIPRLSDAARAFIDWAAWYTCSPRGAMLKMTLPAAQQVLNPGKTSVQMSSWATESCFLNPSSLSSGQQAAADTLAAQAREGFGVTLLDGVTGSGKTEVYFDTMARLLTDSAEACFPPSKPGAAYPGSPSQVLVLLPEIGLSIQWLSRFKERFGVEPGVWHSNVPPARRKALWRAIASGEARVVVGARSALFLPYRNLRLIVVDEEHDASYKQEENVVYHARDMAVARARFENIPALLVSATPSLETWHNARQGKYRELSLPARHGGASMPELTMLDMRHAACARGAFISGPLRAAIGETLAQGHQAMLFLNRRGYAPLVLCRACGYRFQCPHCTAWLVLHKTRPRMQCHHCGFSAPAPSECPSCHAQDKLHSCGPGVEKLHEEAREFLPGARIAVMASDVMENHAELRQTIEAMSAKKLDLLIGTQMIAKGHHFADLALVGVVDADLGLAGGDLRAAERTYQLLHQLSGRAGREKAPGRVFLQSFLPEHPVMRALMTGNRDAFLNAELKAREQSRMPPFSRLAALVVDGADDGAVANLARRLAATAPSGRDVQLLGPAPAPLHMLRGRFRWRLLLKASRQIDLQRAVAQWVSQAAVPAALRVKIDIDPYSFL